MAFKFKWDWHEEALSYERIKMARETLTAAFSVALTEGVGAIGQDDPEGVFSEAKRNLTALVDLIHGREAWKKMLEED